MGDYGTLAALIVIVVICAECRQCIRSGYSKEGYKIRIHLTEKESAGSFSTKIPFLSISGKDSVNNC